MNILIVDDNHNTLKLLHTALTKYGHRIITSDNAPEALSILSQNPIDLIISDMLMPDMDGAEFCRRARQQQGEHYIPIIFLSARNTVDAVATGLSAGADDYLAKPIRLTQLVEKIRQYAM